MSKKGKKFRLKSNPRLHYTVMNESLGTIQINKPELKSFVDRINDDLNNKVFLNKLLSVKTDPKYMEIVLEKPSPKKKHYIMKYNNTGVDWIKNIDIMVIEDGTNEHSMENCAVRPHITTYNDYAIQSGCIIVYNAGGYKQIVDFRGSLYHELHHYFSELNVFVNTCLQLTDDEYYNEEYFNDYYMKKFADNIYFSQHKNNSNIIKFIDYYSEDDYNLYISKLKSYSFNIIVPEIDKIFATMCYWLNNEEIECHLEGIFDRYVKYCKKYGYTKLSLVDKQLVKHSNALKIYNVINKLLGDIDEIGKDKMIYNYFNNRYGHQYYEIFRVSIDYENDKVMTIHQICRKFLSKMKKLVKHFNGMSVYVKNGFVY